MVALWGGAVSYERRTPVIEAELEHQGTWKTPFPPPIRPTRNGVTLQRPIATSAA